MANDGASDASASEDAPARPDTGGDRSPSGQLDLPGIVVWLDGDVGIDASQPGQITWTDRSPYAHVFVGQTVLGGDLPSIAQWNGHQGVRFNRRNRFISEAMPSAAQMDALTLGSTFTVALVFVPEADPMLVLDADEDCYLATASFPWIPAPPDPLTTIPPPVFTFAVMMGGDQSWSFWAGSSGLRVAGTYAAAPQRLVISSSDGNGVRVRLNGQLQGGTVTARPDPGHGSYTPIYLGDWDFDALGFQGVVAEMIIVRGAADQAAEQALDDYLGAKYSP